VGETLMDANGREVALWSGLSCGLLFVALVVATLGLLGVL
jgi:tetrahydromethanopterin S-methyltransferase subunit F